MAIDPTPLVWADDASGGTSTSAANFNRITAEVASEVEERIARARVLTLAADALAYAPAGTAGTSDGTVAPIITQPLTKAALDGAYARKTPPHTMMHPAFGRFWYAALAGKTKPVVAVVGDSIAKKFNAGSIAASWVGLLRAELQAAYGDGGSGFVGMADAGGAAGTFLSGSWSSYADIDRVTLTGTWTLASYVGAGPGVTLGASSTLGSAATFRVRGSEIAVYFLGDTGVGGTFSVKIDAASAVNYTTGSKASIATLRQVVGTGLASTGWHTVVFTLVSGSFNFTGVSGENTTGVVVNNFSRGGATTVEASNANCPNWNGGVDYPCDLMIFALGVNDVGTAVQGVMAANSAQRARIFLSAVREGTANSNGSTDIIILNNHAGSTATRDPNLVTHYMSARYREIVDSYEGCFVDIWAAFNNNYATAAAASYWGGTTVGPPGADTLHPGDIGHGLLYNVLRPAVIPGT